MSNKKEYICSVPFLSLEVHDYDRFLCCASWLKKYLPRNTSAYDAWNSQEALDIRDSIIDGSYRYCDSTQCPFLHQIESIGNVGHIYPMYLKKDVPASINERIENHRNKIKFSPAVVQFSMDRSCNLKCPSCRISVEIADSMKIKKVKQDIQQIQDDYGHEIKTLYITGSGDPFISVAFRDFLRNFDKSKWPNLKSIHLHTNATRWDEKMWNSMKNVWPYIKSCEISIDAATKDTYENKTRLGGNWDELISNLKFISTIPNLQNVKTSFVVQQSNYKEMKLFYDLMLEIFGKKANVFFGKITNWGTFTDEEFKSHQIWNPSHPEHEFFLQEVSKTLPAEQNFNNLQEFITPQKSII